MELTTVVAEASRIVKLEKGREAFEFLLSAVKIGELVFADFSIFPCIYYTTYGTMNIVSKNLLGG